MENTYVNNKQVQSLKDLFSEFDRLDEFNNLFESAKSTYDEFILQKDNLFKIEHREGTGFKIHLLKNKFKNLGMDKSATVLDEIKEYTKGEQSEISYEENLMNRLTLSVDKSLDYIRTNFID